VAAPYLSQKLSNLINQKDYQLIGKSFSLYMLLNVFLFSLIGYQLIHSTHKFITHDFNIVVDPRRYPIYAVHFLKTNNIKGNILLPFEWGEFVIWKLYPDCKVSIDGRFRTVYPDAVLNDHLKASVSEEKWQQLMDKYPPDIILTRRNPFTLKMVHSRHHWIYVYSDNMSIILIKETESQKDVLEKFRIK